MDADSHSVTFVGGTTANCLRFLGARNAIELCDCRLKAGLVLLRRDLSGDPASRRQLDRERLLAFLIGPRAIHLASKGDRLPVRQGDELWLPQSLPNGRKAGGSYV